VHHEAFVTTVMAIVGLLFIAAVSAVFTQRIRFPYTIGLVVIGVAVAFFADDYPHLSHALDAFKLEPVMIMFLFIPILIFESAFKMDVPLLMRNLVPSLVMAGPGLLLSTAIIGGLIYWLTALPLEAALIFGCLISATDPVAVIALFKELGAPERLNIIMEGESVFNDATAIVTFQIILAVIATGIIDEQTISQGVVDFFVVFIGGLLVGLVFGWLLVKAIPLVGNQPLVHITLTLVAAYGAFIVADHMLHTSGIMAVLSAGLMIGYYGHELYTQKVRDYLEMFWEDAAFVANSLIFLMLGLSEKVFLAHTSSNPEGLLYPVLIAIAVVIFARFVVVNSLIPIVNRVPGVKPIDKKYRMVLCWGALRGAVAIALAMSLPNHFPYRWQIIDFAFGVTLFMLLVNGTTMSWLMNKLKLNEPSPLFKFLKTYATVNAWRNTIERLEKYKPVIPFTHAQRQVLLADYQLKLDQAEQQLEQQRDSLDDNRTKLLWLQCFAIQRKVYLKRFEDGLLSRRALQVLEWDLKNHHIRIDKDQITVLGEEHLPSDNKTGFGVLGYIRKLLPDIRYLQTLQKNQLSSLASEAMALIAASRAVQQEISRLREFSGAENEDIQYCRQHYQQLEAMAQARLKSIAESYGASIDAMRDGLIKHLVYDARIDSIDALEKVGELPEDVAHELKELFEEELLAGVKKAHV